MCGVVKSVITISCTSVPHCHFRVVVLKLRTPKLLCPRLSFSFCFCRILLCGIVLSLKDDWVKEIFIMVKVAYESFRW
ncbi:hypothetical protein AHAS_Ahas01G0170900 [Arachis hypogaea]